MYACTLCQKNFKTSQGLAGHNFFVHSNRGVACNIPATQLTEQSSGFSLASASAEQRLSLLEQRASRLEGITGAGETFGIDNVSSTRPKPLIERVAQLAEQLEISRTSNVSQAEFGRVCDRLEELCREMVNLDSQYNAVLDAIAAHDSKLAEQGAILSIQARTANLEKTIDEFARLAKANSDFQEQTMKAIAILSKNIIEALAPIKEQLAEQKQVTDWVKKKFVSNRA